MSSHSMEPTPVCGVMYVFGTQCDMTKRSHFPVSLTVCFKHTLSLLKEEQKKYQSTGQTHGEFIDWLATPIIEKLLEGYC